MPVYCLYYFTQLVMKTHNLWEISDRLKQQMLGVVELVWKTAEDGTEYAILGNWIVVREKE